MKVNSIEQFKILEYLKENLEIELFELELIDRNTIKVTDAKGETMNFKYDNGKIVY